MFMFVSNSRTIDRGVTFNFYTYINVYSVYKITYSYIAKIIKISLNNCRKINDKFQSITYIISIYKYILFTKETAMWTKKLFYAIL